MDIEDKLHASQGKHTHTSGSVNNVNNESTSNRTAEAQQKQQELDMLRSASQDAASETDKMMNELGDLLGISWSTATDTRLSSSSTLVPIATVSSTLSSQ